MPSELTRAFLAEVVRSSGWKLSEVESLSLEGEGIASLGDSFRGVGKLVYLSLARNKLSSLTGIEHLPALATAIFFANRIASVDEIRRLASLPNLRNLDLRLNPIMKKKTAPASIPPDDGGSSVAGASALNGTVGDEYGRSDPRDLVLAALPQVVNLDGRRVTASERLKVRGSETGSSDHRPVEAAKVRLRRRSPALWLEDPEAEDLGGRSGSRAPSLAAALEESCPVRSGVEVGRRGAPGSGQRILRGDMLRVVDDVNPTSVSVVEMTKRDRAGAGVGVSADVVVAVEGLEKNGDDFRRGGGGGDVRVDTGATGGGQIDNLSVADGWCGGGRQRLGAPPAVCKAGTSRVTATGITNGSGNGHDDGDDDLAALWRELDAGSLALRRSTVMPTSAPRSESQHKLSFSVGALPPARRDTRLVVAELNASQGGAFWEEDAARPGRREEHPVDSGTSYSSVDQSSGCTGLTSSRDESVGSSSGALKRVGGRDEIEVHPASECLPSNGRGRGVAGGYPVDRTLRREAASSAETAVVLGDGFATAVPKEVGHAARGIVAAHTSETTPRTMPPHDPSTAAAARALEAFRRSSQRLGLSGVTITGGVGTAAAAASGRRGADASAETGVETRGASGDNAAIVRGNQAGSRADAVAAAEATHNCAPSIGMSDSAGDEARSFASGDSGKTKGARESPAAVTSSKETKSRDKCFSSGLVTSPLAVAISAAAVSKCKECGAIKGEPEAGDDGDDAAGGNAMRRGKGRGQERKEMDELWRRSEVEFDERWKAREREFDEKWVAREREFEERRREESKEFNRGLQAMLFEAHEALIASNAWLVQRLKEVEARSAASSSSIVTEIQKKTKPTTTTTSRPLVTENSATERNFPSGIGSGSRNTAKDSEEGQESAVGTKGSRYVPASPGAILASAGGHSGCDGQERAGYRKVVGSGGTFGSHAVPPSASFGVRSVVVETKTTATAANPRSTGVSRSAPAAAATNLPVACLGCVDAVDDVKSFEVSGHTNTANPSVSGTMYEYEREIRSSPVAKASEGGDRIRDAAMDDAAAELSTAAVQVVSTDPKRPRPRLGGAGTIGTIADGDKVLLLPGKNWARGVKYDGGGCGEGISVAGAENGRGLRAWGSIAPLGVAVSAREGDGGAGGGDHLGDQGGVYGEMLVGERRGDGLAGRCLDPEVTVSAPNLTGRD